MIKFILHKKVILNLKYILFTISKVVIIFFLHTVVSSGIEITNKKENVLLNKIKFFHNNKKSFGR